MVTDRAARRMLDHWIRSTAERSGARLAQRTQQLVYVSLPGASAQPPTSTKDGYSMDAAGYDTARAEVEAIASVRRRRGVEVADGDVDQAAQLLADMWAAAGAVGPDFGGDTTLFAGMAGQALDAVSGPRTAG